MNSTYHGIVADTAELIRCRPSKAVTGFAPTGKVATHQWGANQSVFTGRGMEFSESRTYQAGDDVRNIDWRVTARTGTTHTKLFQEERERPVHILVDMRSMMQFGTRTRFKSHLAAHLAAQLAWIGHDGGDRVGGQLLTRSGIQDFRSARTRRSVLYFLEALSTQTQPVPPEATNNNEASLAQGIHRLRKTCRPGALVFIISDYSDYDQNTNQELVRLSAHTHVTVIHVSDPLDAALPTCGNIGDGTTHLSLNGLSQQQLADYASAYQKRQQSLYQTCRQHGMVLHQLNTSDDPRCILQPRRPA